MGFAALMIAAAGRSLWPMPDVEVVPVIVKRATFQQSGTPLFQAAGWIEPRPTAINVPALAPGVIEDLLVVEGQLVKQGDPIAHLVSIDFEIAVKQAQAALLTAEGELNRAIAEEKAAQARLDQPIQGKPRSGLETERCGCGAQAAHRRIGCFCSKPGTRCGCPAWFWQ